MRDCSCIEKMERCGISQPCDVKTVENLLICAGSPLLEFYRDTSRADDETQTLGFSYRTFRVTPCQKELLEEAVSVIDDRQGPEEGMLEYYEEAFLEASTQQQTDDLVLRGFLFLGVSPQRLRRFVEAEYNVNFLSMDDRQLDLLLLVGAGFDAEEMLSHCKTYDWTGRWETGIYGSFFQILCWMMNRDGRYFHLEDSGERVLVDMLLESLNWRFAEGIGWKQILPQLLGILEQLDTLPQEEGENLFREFSSIFFRILEGRYTRIRGNNRKFSMESEHPPYAEDAACAWQMLRILESMAYRLAVSFRKNFSAAEPQIARIHELIRLKLFLEKNVPLLLEKTGEEGKNLVDLLNLHFAVLENPQAETVLKRVLLQAMDRWKQELEEEGCVLDWFGWKNGTQILQVLQTAEFVQNRYAADLTVFWKDLGLLTLFFHGSNFFVEIVKSVYRHLPGVQAYRTFFWRLLHYRWARYLSIESRKEILAVLQTAGPEMLCPEAPEEELHALRHLYDRLVTVFEEDT